jgi:hypothetical protein
MSQKEKNNNKPASYNHNKDADSNSVLALRAVIQKEINANIIKPIDWSIKNSKTAVKRAKMEYNSQNQNNPIFKLEREANITVITNAALKGDIKFNASLIMS